MESRLSIVLTDRFAFVAQFERTERTWKPTERWRFDVCTPTLPQNAEDVRAFADSLAGQIRREHPAGVVARLVLPLSWCLSRCVDLPSDKWDERAAEFEFEEALPFDLERVTCISVPTTPGRAIVIAAFTEALATLLDTFERHAIAIETATVDIAILCGFAAGGSNSDSHGRE